jgi:hypothetical protein
MTFDDTEIEEMLQQMQWEQSMNQATAADPYYDTTNFDPSLSPLSGYASPSSMTTGSTNPSPSVPLLDYDMSESFAMAQSSDDLGSLFPELLDHPTDMDPAWMGAMPEGFASPFPTSDADQAKATSSYSFDSQLYPTAAPYTTTYSGNSIASTYLTTLPPSSTTTTSPPAAPSSSSSTTQTTPTTTDLTCPHCGATFTEKTKLNVHINKHTKPFKCAAAGCEDSFAEKKSLQRHLLAKSKWDEEHRAAARSEGVREVKHRCPREGCTYTTVRDDNLKRHLKSCAQ